MNMNIEQATKISKASQISEMALTNTKGLKRNELALKIIQNFEEIYPGAKVIYMSETGSGLHGTSKSHFEELTGQTLSQTSDFDTKAIYLPSLSSIVGGETWAQKVVQVSSNSDSKNGDNDIDVTFYPLNHFFDKLSKNMETNAVELLFSMFSQDTIIFETEISQKIRDNYRSLIFNKTEALTNFAVSMASKYSVKGERLNELDNFYKYVKELSQNLTKRERLNNKVSSLSLNIENKYKYISTIEIEHGGKSNTYIKIFDSKFIDTLKIDDFLRKVQRIRNTFGKRAEQVADKSEIDFKAYSHAFRALNQAIELVTTGKLTYPIHNAIELMSVKYMGNTYSKEKLSSDLENLEISLMGLSQNSILSEKSDEDLIISLKMEAYGLR